MFTSLSSNDPLIIVLKSIITWGWVSFDVCSKERDTGCQQAHAERLEVIHGRACRFVNPLFKAIFQQIHDSSQVGPIQWLTPNGPSLNTVTKIQVWNGLFLVRDALLEKLNICGLKTYDSFGFFCLPWVDFQGVRNAANGGADHLEKGRGVMIVELGARKNLKM